MMKEAKRKRLAGRMAARSLFLFLFELTLRFMGGNVHTKLTHTSESEVDMYFNIYK